MLEMILALVAMTFIMMFTITAVSPWVKSYVFLNQKIKTYENARYGLDRMIRELQMVDPGDLGTTLTATRLDYTDASGTAAGFNLVSTQLRRAGSPLFDNVSSLTFRYYDATGTELATPVAVPANVRRIRISLTVDPTGDPAAVKLQGAAFLKGYLYAGFRQ